MKCLILRKSLLKVKNADLTICELFNLPCELVLYSRSTLNGQAEAVAVDDLQAFPGVQELLLLRDVGVAHGAGADHAELALLP